MLIKLLKGYKYFTANRTEVASALDPSENNQVLYTIKKTKVFHKKKRFIVNSTE